MQAQNQLSLIDYKEGGFDVKKHLIPTQKGIENTNKFRSRKPYNLHRVLVETPMVVISCLPFKDEIGGVCQLLKGLGQKKNIILIFRIFKKHTSRDTIHFN